jgi:hypothetical protein
MASPKIPPTLSRGVFGWDAVKLSDAYTANELAAAIQELHADPDNANPAHAAGKSIYLYTRQTMKRTDALGWAIFYRQQDRARAPDPTLIMNVA